MDHKVKEVKPPVKPVRPKPKLDSRAVQSIQKGSIEKTQLNLHRPTAIRESSKRSLKERSPELHQKGEGAKVQDGLARRHIISSNDLKTHYEKSLNGIPLKKAAERLREKGVQVKGEPTQKSVNDAAQKLYANAFNEPRNLWVGDRKENASVQTAVDKPKEWSNHKLGAHKRYMQNKYLYEKKS